MAMTSGATMAPQKKCHRSGQDPKWVGSWDENHAGFTLACYLFILKFYGLIDIVNRWHIFYTDSYSTLLFQVRLASATASFLLLTCQVRAPRPTFGVKTAATCGSARTLKARVRALHQG